MKNEKKTFKILGVVLLIIVIAFAVNIIRKYIILNDLVKKAEINEINNKTYNYHLTEISVTEDTIIYGEEYIKENKKIRYTSSYSKNENRSLSNLIEYEDENESFVLSNDGKNKTKKNVNSIGKMALQNTDKTILYSFNSAIYSKIEKIKFRDKSCYLVQQSSWEYIIEANTGKLLRMISQHEGKSVIQDYYKEIGDVQENDVTKPDVTGYVEE